jgi:hypothetical protein
MQVNTTTTEPTRQTSSYLELTPVMEAMRSSNDKRPKNSLPQNTEGTIQSNAKNIPEVTLYNAHGVLSKTNPNSLLGYA